MLELVGEEVFDLRCDVTHQGCKGARGLAGRGVAHEDPEPVGRPLDVVEQRHRRPFEELARAAIGGQGGGDPGGEEGDLAIDNDGIQALLATKVLVDDRFGNVGGCGDLLDAGPLEALVGEQGPAHLEELLAALAAGHSGSGRFGASRGTHPTIVRSRLPWCGPLVRWRRSPVGLLVGPA